MQTRWIRASALTACIACLPATAPAGETTPPPPPPMSTGMAGQAPYPMPPGQQPQPGLPPQPLASASAAAPEYDPETGRVSFDFAGVRVTQSRTDDAYQLDIDLRGLPPEQVQTRPAGGGLLLVVRRTAETRREETFGDGHGYARSWGFSTGQRVQRLPAPPDADVRAMQREDGTERIQIRIPRRADMPDDGSGFGQSGYGPLPRTAPLPPTPGMTPQQPQGDAQ